MSEEKKNEKMKLFLDVDDTIFKSSEAIIKILNKKYNISPAKTYDDMTDWLYRSICPDMTSEKVKELYESEEFFDIVEYDEDFIKFYENYKNHFDIVIVTKGDKPNLDKKKKKLEDMFGKFKFIGLDMNNGYDKSSVDMRGGIQVDDRSDCLENTNATIKILITHRKKLDWNKLPVNVENLYETADWNDAGLVIDTCVRYPEVMMR